jgi:hypothetical protein
MNDNYWVFATLSIIIIIKTISRCYGYYCDYQKTVHTNNTQIKMEQLRLKNKKCSGTDAKNNLRIDKKSS